MSMRFSGRFIPVLFLAPLAAQEFRANITGTITDASGAPVAGAKVEALSVERQVGYDATSNDAGTYLIRFLPPGKYSVTAQKEGFKRALRDGLALQSADRLNVDIRLEVGGVRDHAEKEKGDELFWGFHILEYFLSSCRLNAKVSIRASGGKLPKNFFRFFRGV